MRQKGLYVNDNKPHRRKSGPRMCKAMLPLGADLANSQSWRGSERGIGDWRSAVLAGQVPTDPLDRHLFHSQLGALDGGCPCRMSILRNANVACLFAYLFLCPLSNLRNDHVACHYDSEAPVVSLKAHTH